MGKTPPKKLKPEDIETESGAEERFERTVRHMLNTPLKPHKPTQKEGDSKVASKPRRKKVRSTGTLTLAAAEKLSNGHSRSNNPIGKTKGANLSVSVH